MTKEEYANKRREAHKLYQRRWMAANPDKVAIYRQRQKEKQKEKLKAKLSLWGRIKTCWKLLKGGVL